MADPNPGDPANKGPVPANPGASPANQSPVPAAGVGAAEIGKILLVILAVVVPIGFKFINAQREYAKEHPHLIQLEKARKEQLQRGLREMEDQINRGAAGEAVQLLFGVKPEDVKKPKAPNTAPEPDSENAAAAEQPVAGSAESAPPAPPQP
ncbi:MAG TPA: hypothetical protein VGJ26_22410 [Pirellulales bacterium]